MGTKTQADSISSLSFFIDKPQLNKRREQMRLLIALCLVTILAIPAYAIEPQVQADLTIKQRIEIEGIDAKYSAQNYNLALPLTFFEKLSITPSAGLTLSQIDIANVDLDSGIGWNIGLDAEYLLYEGIVDASLIGSYRLSRVDIDEIGGIENPYETILLLNEYEAGAKVSKKIGPVTPYVALVYSGLDGDIDTPFADADVEEVDNYGLRLGLYSSPLEALALSVEASLFDKKSIAGKVSYKF